MGGPFAMKLLKKNNLFIERIHAIHSDVYHSKDGIQKIRREWMRDKHLDSLIFSLRVLLENPRFPHKLRVLGFALRDLTPWRRIIHKSLDYKP